ncbi:MAG: hypothetical protein WB947_01785 [Thermoplasmata archaeon]
MAHPEVDASMKRFGVAVIALVLLAGSLVASGPLGVAAGHPVPASTPVTGNITGATVLAYSGAAYYTINATGGPAFAANGTQVGNLTYYASVTGANITGVSIEPSEGGLTNHAALKPQLSVGTITETLTITVEIASVYQTANVSTNLTYTVNVVQPYVLTLDLISTASVTILGFTLIVDLDGTPVGTISVPSLTAKQSYTATFSYATLGLGSGYHTFTVSLPNEHGLVTFAGGSSTYSDTFYVPGSPPNYTLWYLAGAIAFFGAIFIFLTRVAARRRNPSRR